MKTEYIHTDFAEITPTIKRAWEIKSHARGKNLIPLARGERPPSEREPNPTQPTEVDVTTTDSTMREERRSFFPSFGRAGDDDGGQG